MGDQRERYAPEVRERAGQLYIHKGMTLQEIADRMKIPLSTLTNWSSKDGWVRDSEERNEYQFAQTCEFLMRTIHRLAQRLFESTLPPDDDPYGEFILPDENIELRINRLTLALDRVLPMGNLLLTKQRIDVAKEIKQHGFECVERKTFTDDQVLTAFQVIEHYLGALDVGKKDKDHGRARAA